MQANRSRAYLASLLIIPLALIVAACGVTPTALTTTGAGATQTTGQTTGAVPQLVNCAMTLPEMRGAQVVAIPNIDFPNSGAAIVAITSSTSAPLQVVQYTACMQVFAKGTIDHVSVPIVSNTSSPTAEVMDALNLVGSGWVSQSTFPFDGANLLPCDSAQLCFVEDPQYYLELEQIADHTNGVLTFVLRMASPQPLVSCDPAFFPADNYPSSIDVLANAEFPLPPLTRISSGYGAVDGIMTYFCTAGTVASIQTFMSKMLPPSGWSPLMANGVRVWKFPSGVGPVYMRILPITDPHKWAVLTYQADANLG